MDNPTIGYFNSFLADGVMTNSEMKDLEELIFIDGGFADHMERSYLIDRDEESPIRFESEADLVRWHLITSGQGCTIKRYKTELQQYGLEPYQDLTAIAARYRDEIKDNLAQINYYNIYPDLSFDLELEKDGESMLWRYRPDDKLSDIPTVIHPLTLEEIYLATTQAAQTTDDPLWQQDMSILSQTIGRLHKEYSDRQFDFNVYESDLERLLAFSNLSKPRGQVNEMSIRGISLFLDTEVLTAEQLQTLETLINILPPDIIQILKQKKIIIKFIHGNTLYADYYDQHPKKLPTTPSIMASVSETFYEIEITVDSDTVSTHELLFALCHEIGHMIQRFYFGPAWHDYYGATDDYCQVQKEKFSRNEWYAGSFSRYAYFGAHFEWFPEAFATLVLANANISVYGSYQALRMGRGASGYEDLLDEMRREEPVGYLIMQRFYTVLTKDGLEAARSTLSFSAYMTAKAAYADNPKITEAQYIDEWCRRPNNPLFNDLDELTNENCDTYPSYDYINYNDYHRGDFLKDLSEKYPDYDRVQIERVRWLVAFAVAPQKEESLNYGYQEFDPKEICDEITTIAKNSPSAFLELSRALVFTKGASINHEIIEAVCDALPGLANTELMLAIGHFARCNFIRGRFALKRAREALKQGDYIGYSEGELADQIREVQAKIDSDDYYYYRR